MPHRAIADLSSLGPVTAQRLAEVGIRTEAQLAATGAADAYRQLKFRFGKAVTLNALWGLDAAIRHVDWRMIDNARKAELRRAAGLD